MSSNVMFLRKKFKLDILSSPVGLTTNESVFQSFQDFSGGIQYPLICLLDPYQSSRRKMNFKVFKSLEKS